MKIQIYESVQETSSDEQCSIQYLCQLAGISRASYYKWIHRKPSRVDIEDARILPLIKAIADENNSLYGYQKMTYALNNNSDVKYNRKRIYRIMAINGIESHFRIDRRHSTYRKSTPQETKDNLLDPDFNAEAPNLKWGTDITEMKYAGDKLYISTILDLYDRYPVGVVVSRRNDTKLVHDTYFMAITLNQGATPLLHSDRGFQYTRKIFSKMLENDGLTQSMSRVGHCIDNGPVESFQGFIKDMAKVLFGKAHTYEEAAEIIYRTYEYYIYRYPQKRFHGKTANQVSQEVLTTVTPEQYPIAPNRRIERFWEGIEKSKAKHQEQEQQ